MRENRAKESKEAKAERKMKDNEATKEALANETEEENQLRLAKNRKYKENRNKYETDEQKKDRNVLEAAQRKARRHAAKEKAAKLAEVQSQVSAEFQRIQTPPRTIRSKNQNFSEVSKNLSQKVGLPCRNDGKPSSGSDLNADSMSDYEKLRLRNIEERNQNSKRNLALLAHLMLMQSQQNPKMDFKRKKLPLKRILTRL